MNYKSYLYSLFGLLVCCFLLYPSNGQAATNPGSLPGDDNSASSTTQTSIAADDDAIAVRVLPNPNHYSAARWYKSQGFSGSLQSLLVDGYDAVRDGRTVYVNAANVDVNNKLIYTNIYLISYNQNPDFKTIDVLGQIVSHWRFNSNLGTAGMCTISTLPCWSTTDCDDGMTCFGKSAAPGRCVPTETVDCYTDSECPQGIYCDSLRSKFARDVRRLGMLGDLRESLATYKKQNNKYPILGAGTYLPLNSVSVWPSWQALLLSQLGASQSLVDPINTLGPCADHDVKTCWNEDTNSFADPTPANSTLELPGGSYAFVYSGDKNGSNYSLCGAIETKSLGYNTTEGQLASAGCVNSGSGYVGSTNNLTPILIATNLQGEPDQPFNGFIKVIDPEGNPLSWALNTGSTSWPNWKNNNQNNVPPILQDTANPNQKKIFAQAAGNAGTYNLAINVSDGSSSLATITPINIINKVPNIQSEDVVYYPNTSLPLIVRFSITEKHAPISYTFAKATYNSGPYDVLAASNGTTVTIDSNKVGDTTTFTRKYIISTSNKFTHDTTFTYVVTARDRFNVSSTRQINITIKADPPILDFNCNKSVRVGTAYYCNLGLPQQGDHIITYSAVGTLPPGLSIGLGTTGGGVIIPPLGKSKTLRRFTTWLDNTWQKVVVRAEAAVPSPNYSLRGTPTTASSSYLVKIKAENEFGAISEREFNLSVNNYCGDGLRQMPNLEGRGGFYNDGLEDCDGNAGVAVNRSQIASSSPSLQYGCTTKVGAVVPYPITNNLNVCVFSSPLEETGGGYCGDGICQYKITRNGVNIPWEADGYCTTDCTCAGAHQSMVGGECTCDAGWYDCDSLISGCESNAACSGSGACLPSQYKCGDSCVSRASLVNCGLNKAVCYKYPSSPPNTCITACESGFYNCDGLYECENTMCACPSGQHWDGAAWPNAKCVNNVVDPCPGTPLPCGNTCYNPATQKCCTNNNVNTVCGISQVCCLVNNATQCVASVAHCILQQQSNSSTNIILD